MQELKLKNFKKKTVNFMTRLGKDLNTAQKALSLKEKKIN